MPRSDKRKMVIDFNIDAVVGSTEQLIDQFINESVAQLLAEIDRLKKMGVGDKAIKQKLLNDLENETGIFRTLANRLGRVSMAAVNQANQAAYYQEAVDVKQAATQKYMWVLDPGAQHCGTCPTKHGVVHTFAEWQELGLPGSGVDECGHNCRCSLIPV